MGQVPAIKLMMMMTCQGNARDVVNSQGIVREMSGKKSCHGKLSQNCSLLDEY